MFLWEPGQEFPWVWFPGALGQVAGSIRIQFHLTSKLLLKKVTLIYVPMRVCFPSLLAAFDILQLLNICQPDKYKTYIYILTKFSMIFPSHPYLFSYSKSQVVLF